MTGDRNQSGFTLQVRSAEHGFMPQVRSAEHGFTLIEIMVALAVFALAAMALVRLESATIRGAGILDQTLAAQMVARTIAVETVTDAVAPARGKTGGTATNAGRRWVWTRDVQPIGDAGVFRVDVSVADASGTSLARLTMIRPPIAPI